MLKHSCLVVAALTTWLALLLPSISATSIRFFHTTSCSGTRRQINNCRAGQCYYGQVEGGLDHGDCVLYRATQRISSASTQISAYTASCKEVVPACCDVRFAYGSGCVSSSFYFITGAEYDSNYRRSLSTMRTTTTGQAHPNAKQALEAYEQQLAQHSFADEIALDSPVNGFEYYAERNSAGAEFLQSIDEQRLASGDAIPELEQEVSAGRVFRRAMLGEIGDLATTIHGNDLETRAECPGRR